MNNPYHCSHWLETINGVRINMIENTSTTLQALIKFWDFFVTFHKPGCGADGQKISCGDIFYSREGIRSQPRFFFQLLNNWISIGGLRWKSLSSSFYLFRHVPNRVISDWLGFREVCLQNGLLTHPLNSITPTNIYFFRLFGVSYISHVKFLSHCNQSAWKYFIHKIKTNSKNLALLAP